MTVYVTFLTCSSYPKTPSNANVKRRVIALPIALVSNDIAAITAFMDSGALKEYDKFRHIFP